MKKNIIIIICGLALLGLSSSCSIEPTLADRDAVDLVDENTMRHMVDGAYNQMVDYRFLGRNTIIAGEVRSDNMYSMGNSNRFVPMSKMELLPTHADVDEIFKYGYKTLANTNFLINSEFDEVDGDEANKHHTIAEAYTIRALVHFELLKLYGQQYISAGDNLGISYIKEYKGEDLNIPRGSVESNKDDLYNDIDNALTHFTQAAGSEYSSTRVYLTEDAAYALKSRIATYFKDYGPALDASSQIVDEYTVTPADKVVEYWEQTTPGAASIFELAQSNTPAESQSINGITNIYRFGSYGDVVAFNNLLEDAEFEPTDVRASTDMIDTEGTGNYLRNVGKYPTIGTGLGSDNIKVFRIEEVVLNHAEALLETGDAGTALTYLNKITQNREATDYAAATIENILKERRKELLFEGFRFHDLARHGLDIKDMDPTSLNNHGLVPAGDNKFAMPIPRAEVDANRETTQNPGY